MINYKPLDELATEQDGQRILVERIWPNRLDQHTAKAILKINDWCQNAAPSIELAQWYQQQDVQRNSSEKLAQEFWRRYKQELMAHPEHWMFLLDMARSANLTLLYVAELNDSTLSEHVFLNNLVLNYSIPNHAKMLAAFLEDELDRFNDASSPVCYAHLNKLD